MSAEAFERAALFRVRLAQRLGLPEGKDPENVGIALGPDDSTLVVSMPLSTAESLLEERAPADMSPGEQHEARIHALARSLSNFAGREVALMLEESTPLAGLVVRVLPPPGSASSERPFVVLNTSYGTAEIYLDEIKTVSNLEATP